MPEMLTAREIVSLFGRLKGVPDRRVDEVLDLSEVAMEELGPPAVKIGEEAAGVVEAEFDCEGRAVCGLHLPAIVKGLVERDEGVVGRGA